MPHTDPYPTAPREASAGGLHTDRVEFARRVLLGVGIAISVVLVLLLLWSALDVLLLVFAGVLLALFLRAMSDWVSGHTPLSDSWALGIVGLTLVLLLGGGGWLLAPVVGEQFQELSEQLPRSVDQLRQQVERYRWGARVLEQAPAPDDLAPDPPSLVGQMTGFFSTAFGALANIVIVLFIGLYFAANPGLYRRGIVRLVPMQRRERARVVLQTLASTLRWWLLGQLFSMTVIGALTTLGLWLLGVRLAVVLGLLAGLLEFIPTFGPLLSAVPAILLALVDGPRQALFVILLYVGIQFVESYLVTPLVQQQTVELPPVVTIVSIIVLGGLLGFLGLLLATPLAAAIMILVKMLYIEGVLGDESIDAAG